VTGTGVDAVTSSDGDSGPVMWESPTAAPRYCRAIASAAL
jgi:hypothetical protein